MKNSPFDATISVLDAATSVLDAATSALNAATSVLNAATSVLDAATSALDTAISPIAQSYQHSRGVTRNISNCRVGIISQMFNRVTNHGEMGTFSKPAFRHGNVLQVQWHTRGDIAYAEKYSRYFLNIIVLYMLLFSVMRSL